MSIKLDLLGVVLNIAVSENYPHVFSDYGSNESPLLSGGYEMIIAKEMAKHFNFTFRTIDCFYDWGTLLEYNNSWTGIVGHLSANTADIGLGGITVTLNRSLVVDYLVPHAITPITFITSWPTGYSSTFTIDSFEPFEPLVPIYLMFSFMTVLALLSMINKVWHKSYNVWTNAWLLIQALLWQQPTKCQTRSTKLNSVRLALSSWQLMTLLLGFVYSVFIFKSITCPVKLQTIDTLRELAVAQRMGSIEVMGIELFATYQQLKSGYQRDIYERIRFVNTDEEGIDRVMKAVKYRSFIGPRDKFEFDLYRSGRPAYHLPPEPTDSAFNVALLALAVRKRLPYKPVLDEFVQNIIQSGLISHWKHIGYENSGKHISYKSGKEFADRIDSKHVNHIMCIIYIGVCVSAVTLAAELWAVKVLSLLSVCNVFGLKKKLNSL